MLASAPLLPKFVSEGAAPYHELRKRGTSAADLKFLQRLRQAHEGTSNRKAALESYACWCPFASEVRVRGCRYVSRTSEAGHQDHMHIRTRKLIGTIALLVLVIVWALLAMGFAQMLPLSRNHLIETAYYIVAGLGWVLPA